MCIKCLNAKETDKKERQVTREKKKKESEAQRAKLSTSTGAIDALKGRGGRPERKTE